MRLKHLFLFLLLAFPAISFAQFSPIDTSVGLTAFPQFPEPFQEVEVSINAATIDTTSAKISWTIDGKEILAARNERSLKYTVGDIGSRTNISAFITTSNGINRTLSLQLRPTRILLILEADTLVPAFYKGRPLPTSGSSVRAITLPNLGNNLSPQEYSYKWQLNNKLLDTGTVFGKNEITFTMPSVGPEDVLYVDVFDRNGTLVGQTAIQLPNVEAEILFYEHNPLRGLSLITLRNPLQLTASEITVRAEPYFMNRAIMSSSPLLEWKVEGSKIDNPSNDPLELTLQRQGETGRFNIDFHIRNMKDFLQGGRANFTLQF